MTGPLFVKSALDHLEVWAHRLADWLAGAGIVGLLLLAVATTLDVVLRYTIAQPIRGLADVLPLAGAVSLASCMPYTVAARSHIRVDLLGQKLLVGARSWLDNGGQVLTIAFFGVMTWRFAEFSKDAFNTGETMALLRWVIWPWWSAVTVFLALATLVGLLTLLQSSVQESSHA